MQDQTDPNERGTANTMLEASDGRRAKLIKMKSKSLYDGGWDPRPPGLQKARRWSKAGGSIQAVACVREVVWVDVAGGLSPEQPGGVGRLA